eukprot:2492870-Prymnesium_polylepis.1
MPRAGAPKAGRCHDFEGADRITCGSRIANVAIQALASQEAVALGVHAGPAAAAQPVGGRNLPKRRVAVTPDRHAAEPDAVCARIDQIVTADWQ